MYSVITSSSYGKVPELDYRQRKDLDAQILDIVEKYFDAYPNINPYSSASVVYSGYSYIFTVGGNRSTQINLELRDNATQTLKAFRSAIRRLLKSNGFTSVKFNIDTVNGYSDKYTGYSNAGDTSYSKKVLRSIVFE